MLVWLSKMDLALQDSEHSKRHSRALHLLFDWLDSLICPGGFLLVVSHLFAVPVLVLWVGLEKSKELILDVRNIFAG
jgi:hypothetical protein